MLKNESKQAVENFVDSADTEINAFLKARSTEEYEAAAKLILESQAQGGPVCDPAAGKGLGSHPLCPVPSRRRTGPDP